MEGIRLLFRRGEERLLQLRLDRAELSVGSGPTNDVMVPGAPPSAARIVPRGEGRYRLTDLTGGMITVDGASLDAGWVDLRWGQSFELGSYVLELHADAPVAERGDRTGLLARSAPDPSRRAWIAWGQRRLELDAGDRFGIGTDLDNHLVLDDRFVSSFHCRITFSGSQWRITDLDSTNGTTVNGLRVREAELPDGARVGVGRAELVFSTRPPAETSAATGMVVASGAMRRVFEWVRRFADAEEPVLVVGASGTGKEGICRALHDVSNRTAGPFVALNCGALAPSLIESELFGHVRGAFTGAHADKVGAFEAASGGTIFLDEVGELPLELQPKLLRVLETKTIRRVGGTSEISVDPRVVAATHRNLEALVAEGRFRADLFHRLFVLSIPIPPLAERPEDIEALAEHFLVSSTLAPKRLSPGAIRALKRHRWPGNARELRNVIVRALLSTDGPVIEAADLEFSSESFSPSPWGPTRRSDRSAAAERDQIAGAIQASGGNRAAAARRLGISKSTFYDKVRRLGL